MCEWIVFDCIGKSTMSLSPYRFMYGHRKLIALPWHDAFVYGPLNCYHSNKIKQTMRTQMIERCTDITTIAEAFQRNGKRPLALYSVSFVVRIRLFTLLKSIVKWKLAMFNRVYAGPNMSSDCFICLLLINLINWRSFFSSMPRWLKCRS